MSILKNIVSDNNRNAIAAQISMIVIYYFNLFLMFLHINRDLSDNNLTAIEGYKRFEMIPSVEVL